MCDGMMRVRKLWGPYSPKLYDGNFLKSHKSDFNEEFRGATVIADTHFELGNQITADVAWRIPVSKRRGRKRKYEEVDIPSLTKAQQNTT